MSLMKKTMNRLSSQRNGGAMIVVVLLVIVLLALAGGAFFQGSQKQKKQTQLLAEGYTLFNSGKLAEAFQQFKEVKGTFSGTLDLYRKVVKSESYLSTQDLSELIISICLSLAYDKFFDLETAEEWLVKAEEELNQLGTGDQKTELGRSVATAREVAKLCQTFKAGEAEKAMKNLLEVEKNALPTDQDFFIFEIRLLIACGKALGSQDIIKQARELLFFATTDAGINNDKTGKLWVLLTN